MSSQVSNMKIRDLVNHKRAEILNLAHKNGAFNVRIFGALLRDEEDANSQIDFLVELEPDRTLLDWVGLKQGLEELLEHEIHLADVNGLPDRFRDLIVKEAIPL